MLEDLESLLLAVAEGEVPNRLNATMYSNLRLSLLRDYDPAQVPGFLFQCISVYKFREFINLYDGRIDLRRQFIKEVFDKLLQAIPGSRIAPGEQKLKLVSRVF